MVFRTSSLETGMSIELEAKVNEVSILVLKLMFAFGLTPEIQFTLTLLARAGLVNSQQLKKEEKYAIVIAFIVATILTPPDLISQDRAWDSYNYII